MGTVGILIAVFFIAGGLHNFHARPVGIKFVGYDAGQSRFASAAHLGAVGNDIYSAVGVDGEINVGMQRGIFHRRNGVGGYWTGSCRKDGLRRPANGEYQRAGAEQALQKFTAAGLNNTYGLI